MPSLLCTKLVEHGLKMVSGCLALVQATEQPKMAPYINRKLVRCTTWFLTLWMDRDVGLLSIRSISRARAAVRVGLGPASGEVSSDHVLHAVHPPYGVTAVSCATYRGLLYDHILHM